MKIDFQELLHKLSEYGSTITIAADNPSLKTEFLVSACISAQKTGCHVLYLDFDIQFSSYLSNYKLLRGLDTLGEGVLVHVSDVKNGFVDVVDFLVTNWSDKTGLIIIDSLNSLQNELKIESSASDSVTANHKVAILLTLLQLLARKSSAMIWISNSLRNKPVMSDDSLQWDKVIVGGRMIQNRTDVTALLDDSNAANLGHGGNYEIGIRPRGTEEWARYEIGFI